MKFCPYCGASLPGSTISFCTECGQALNVMPQQNQEEIEKESQVQSDAGETTRAGERVKSSRRKIRKEKKPKKQRRLKKKNRRDKEVSAAVPVVDDGYDGYYDDVKPIEKGNYREGLEPELIKRIIFITVGAVILVLFSIVVMYVL